MVGQVQSVELSFDGWRARYDEMSETEHVEFARACVGRYPDQNRTDLLALDRFFRGVAKEARHVIEVGGHAGAAADYVLNRHPGIVHWLNVEIAPSPWRKHWGSRYSVVAPDTFRWWRGDLDTGIRDTAVFSHVLEHLRVADVDELLTVLHADRAYVECPVGDEPRSWDGYHGTHILEVGWRGLHDLFAEHGFVPVKLTDEAYAYRRDHHVDPGT